MTVSIVEERAKRLRTALGRRELAAVLVFGPENMRFATGYEGTLELNFQHAERWALVFAQGEPIIWDHPEAIRAAGGGTAIRPASGWDLLGPPAPGPAEFGVMVADALRERGVLDLPLGVDGAETPVYLGLADAGITVCDARAALDEARLQKGGEELKAMRATCGIASEAMAEAGTAIVAAKTIGEVFTAFEQAARHRGAERCIPMSGLAERVVPEEPVVLDVQLIGEGGFLVHIARTFPRDGAGELAWGAVNAALADVLERCGPDVPFARLQRPGVLVHGCGLGEEFPLISEAVAPPGALQLHSVLSVGVHISGVHIRDQILVTQDGYELLT